MGVKSKRDSEAKLYRKKMLEAKNGSFAGKKPKPASKMSEDLKKKKMKQDAHGHGVGDADEKASFGQCLFNMGNALMVSYYLALILHVLYKFVLTFVFL